MILSNVIWDGYSYFFFFLTYNQLKPNRYYGLLLQVYCTVLFDYGNVLYCFTV